MLLKLLFLDWVYLIFIYFRFFSEKGEWVGGRGLAEVGGVPKELFMSRVTLQTFHHHSHTTS